MMMSWELVLSNGVLVLALMTLLWALSVVRRDASIVDPWWSMAFLLVTVNTAARSGWTSAKLLIVGTVGLWALRLWIHLLVRSFGKPEDPRYAAFRRQYGPHRYWWVSFFQVFLLQGLLVMVISAPLQLAAAATTPDPLTVWHGVGALLFVVGFAFEGIADLQLQRFRNDPANRGAVLDSGLWGVSRHPNYFGEALLWWGFWLYALAQPFGWATVFAPALMTFLLLRVSGVSMLDAHLARSRPGYADYVQRTPAFFPRWERRRA